MREIIGERNKKNKQEKEIIGERNKKNNKRKK